MKLTTITQLSVDGVMQGPGAPVPGIVERGQFDRDGWAHFDNEAGAAMDEIFRLADAFLFGRLTYQIFANSWGTWKDMDDSPIWTALHTKSKYVVSNSLINPEWKGTTVLNGDIVKAIHELKAKPGRELQIHGSGNLIRLLLENNLIDEMTLFTFPVVVGKGTRLFSTIGPDINLELEETQATPSGITISRYKLAGHPKYTK